MDPARKPLSTDVLPVSGAWTPEQPVGERKFFTFDAHPFALEGGGLLSEFTLAYETWGTLSPAADNAVLVCHALTGDAHAAGRSGPGQPTPGWWDDVIGPGKAIDTDRYFVVCSNVLGGCQGSTGPASTNPATGAPYGSSFPVVSIRDMVRAQARLATHLGISRWRSVVGGSMGGMQALEWGVMFPDRARSMVAIATCAASSAQQIAYSTVQRSAIALDPNWNGGDYYTAEPGHGPHWGLAVARQLAQTTYRTDAVFAERFDRGELDPIDSFDRWQRFDVEGYLDYQGAKLVRRFDANSYVLIAKAMDLHDVGRGRGGVGAALARVRCPTLTISISSDTLYPSAQQELIRDAITAAGTQCQHAELDSPDGHDAFLLAADQVAAAVQPFLADVESPNG